MAEHGETDEKERPGITGDRTEATQTKGQTDGRSHESRHETVAADGAPDRRTDGSADRRPETDRQTSGQTERQAGPQTDKHKGRIQDKSEDTTRLRGANKRPAEEEADDSSRGDRVDWRNFVEPSSSSQAPSSLPPAVELRPTGSTGESGSDNVISDVVATTPVVSGGTKRPQDDHAMMDYDGAEVETKTQRISSICFGIGSDDITGEINAVDHDEDLK